MSMRFMARFWVLTVSSQRSSIKESPVAQYKDITKMHPSANYLGSNYKIETWVEQIIDLGGVIAKLRS